MPDNSNIYPKISRALKSLLAETDNKIAQIRNREYGMNIVEDLQLINYANFFDETINYFRRFVKGQKDLAELDENLSPLFDYDICELIEKMQLSMYDRLLAFFLFRRTSQSGLADELRDILESLRGKTENSLYWMSIQEG